MMPDFTITDFLGYTAEFTGPPGVIADLGEFHTPMRSRGFQIGTDGSVEKSKGYSVIGQVFDTDYLYQCHGIHYWKGGGVGSTLLFAGQFGLKFSISKSESSGTHPYMLRFATTYLDGPYIAWPTDPSYSAVDGLGPYWLFGNFAEYQDRIYYCNGMDPPKRIDGIHSLFVNSTISNPRFSAMGVSEPSLTSSLNVYYPAYAGKRADAAGVNTTHPFSYFVSAVSKYGESPLKAVDVPTYVDETAYAIFELDWSYVSDFVTAVNIYRIPKGGLVPQFVGSISRNSTYIDISTDADLGGPAPTDVGRPSNFRLLCTFEDRMFAVGGFGQANRLACSKAGYPDVWPALYTLSLGSSLGSRMITRLENINGSLYVIMDAGILRMYGSSPDNYAFQSISMDVGCIAPRSMVPKDDGRVFLGNDGIYFFNGASYRKIGGSIVTELHRRTKGSRDLRHACGAINGDYYYLSYRDDSEKKFLSETEDPIPGTMPNRTLVLNMSNDRVGVIDDWAFALSTPYEHNQSIVLGGDVASN